MTATLPAPALRRPHGVIGRRSGRVVEGLVVLVVVTALGVLWLVMTPRPHDQVCAAIMPPFPVCSDGARVRLAWIGTAALLVAGAAALAVMIRAAHRRPVVAWTAVGLLVVVAVVILAAYGPVLEAPAYNDWYWSTVNWQRGLP
jgi:hypothetical protein